MQARVVVIVCKEIALEDPRGRKNSAGAQCSRGPRTEPWDANTYGFGGRGAAGEPRMASQVRGHRGQRNGGHGDGGVGSRVSGWEVQKRKDRRCPQDSVVWTSWRLWWEWWRGTWKWVRGNRVRLAVKGGKRMQGESAG